MKKIFFAAVMISLAGGAYCADWKDLAADASTLKEYAEAPDIKVEPAVSRDMPGLPPADALQDNDSRWYGADSRQARMQFTAYLLYKTPPGYTGAVPQILSNPAQRRQIRELVDLQLRHMYGAFTTHPGFVNNPGIPSGDYKVTLLGAEKADGAYAKITYSYDDIVVFSDNLFRGGGATRIQFVLPADPVTIYRKGFSSPNSRKNLCTDEHYNSEGDFWYF
ncbi:MAG: hypothetical protein HY796_12010 [Elusimicrobia bacterium]|nr:hypothetical protein [Elusimicrobiota bacterium]